MLITSKHAKKIVDNLVWITGPARSGTSIIGKIISTTKSIEYFYEPETLFSLIPIYKTIDTDKWNLLYQTYIYNDLLFNSLVGRKLNFRKKDLSSIYNNHSKSKVKFKLNNNLDLSKIGKYFVKNKIKVLIKMPDVTGNLIKIKNDFNKNKIIVTDRDSHDLLNSLIQKKWFKKKNYLNYNFPGKKIGKNIFPFWLPRRLYRNWLTFNHEEKCAQYVITMKENIKKIDYDYYINFGEFLKNPRETIEQICNKFNLKPTSKTNLMLKSVREKKINYKLRFNYNIRKTILTQFNKIH